MGWIWHEVFMLGYYGHDNPSPYYNIAQESKQDSVFKPSILFVSELSGSVFNRKEIKKNRL